MKIELKELYCTEWEFGREIQFDQDKAFSVSAYIGPVGSDASECFMITVCSIEYVRKLVERDGSFSGLWYLILDSGNRAQIEMYFLTQIGRLSGETWEEYQQKLRLVGRSEFEDYKE